MSTRASIFYTDDSHVYEESSEPVEQWGRFVGSNIYAMIGLQELKSFEFNGKVATVRLRSDKQLAKESGQYVWMINASDVLDIKFDSEGLALGIVGGSLFAIKLQTKNFYLTPKEYYQKWR